MTGGNRDCPLCMGNVGPEQGNARQHLIKHQHILKTSWPNKMNVEPIWTVSLLLRSKDAQNRQWEPRGGVGGGLNRQDSGPFRQFCQNQVPFQSNYIYQIRCSKFRSSLYTTQQNVFQNKNKSLQLLNKPHSVLEVKSGTD